MTSGFIINIKSRKTVFLSVNKSAINKSLNATMYKLLLIIIYRSRSFETISLKKDKHF